MSLYQEIRKAHKHICNWKCELPEFIELTQKEYIDLSERIKSEERPVLFYKGMRVVIV